MLHPSYSDLMNVVNSGVEEGEEPVVSSRYSIVMATSKRARQIIAGDEPLVEEYEGSKPLSIAVEELNQGKIRILGDDEEYVDEEASDLGDEEDMELNAAQEEAPDMAGEEAENDEAVSE